jgi:hypothetical protein
MTTMRAYIAEDSHHREVGIGYYILDVSDPSAHLHHWVQVPKSEITSIYCRKITMAEVDIIKSFDLLPELTVEYRPISKFISRYFDPVWIIVTSFLSYAIILVVCTIVLGQSNELSIWIASTAAATMSVLLITACVGNWRYNDTESYRFKHPD